MNYFYSLLSNLSRMLVGFIAVVILSNYLTVEDFGSITWWLLISTILGIFFDFGYTVFLSKEIKRGEYENLTSSLILKSKIILATCLITFAVLSYNNIPYYPFILILAFGFNALCSSFAVVLRVNDRFREESILVFSNNTFIIILLFCFLELKLELFALPLAYLISKLLYLLYYLYVFKDKIRFNIRQFDTKKHTIKLLPYFLQGFFGYLYLNVDGVVMPLYVSSIEVGYYQAASKLFLGALLFSEVISSVLIPKIAQEGLKSSIDSKFISKCNVVIISFGITLSSFLYFMSEFIIVKLFGADYLMSVEYFELLVVVIFLRYFGLIYGLTITISGYQSFRTVSTVLTLILMCILCLFLMPSYGVFGGIMALIFSHLFINILYVAFCKYKFKRFLIL